MYDTVLTNAEKGLIKVRKRVTADDLWFAAEWLEAFEGDPADAGKNMTALASVARYLRNEARRRERRVRK